MRDGVRLNLGSHSSPRNRRVARVAGEWTETSNKRLQVPMLPTGQNTVAGLYRTTMVGPGASLLDAFEAIETSTRVALCRRHCSRDVVSARVALSPEEGTGCWELLRIRDELYVILTDFAYSASRIEVVPGDDLVQFNFKVSGDM